MNFTIQTKVSKKAARAFIRGMETNGFEVRSPNQVDFTFKKNGQISINYSVTILDQHAFIGVRPTE